MMTNTHQDHIMRRYRKKYNPDYVPFSSNSQHMNGIAADIVVRGIPADGSLFKSRASTYRRASTEGAVVGTNCMG